MKYKGFEIPTGLTKELLAATLKNPKIDCDRSISCRTIDCHECIFWLQHTYTPEIDESATERWEAARELLDSKFFLVFEL